MRHDTYNKQTVAKQTYVTCDTDSLIMLANSPLFGAVPQSPEDSAQGIPKMFLFVITEKTKGNDN